MNKQEYEQKRSQCWGEFCRNHPIEATATGCNVFRFAFDSGFELGKQEIKQEIKQETDAAGEEMIIVSRKDVQERYAANERLKEAFPKSDIYLASNAINDMLQDLFGAKCLPDKTPLSQNSSENCDKATHISTGDNTSQKWPIREYHSGDTSQKWLIREHHSGDTSHESEVLMKITSRSPITISIIQVKDKGAQV